MQLLNHARYTSGATAVAASGRVTLWDSSRSTAVITGNATARQAVKERAAPRFCIRAPGGGRGRGQESRRSRGGGGPSLPPRTPAAQTRAWPRGAQCPSPHLPSRIVETEPRGGRECAGVQPRLGSWRKRGALTRGPIPRSTHGRDGWCRTHAGSGDLGSMS